MRSRSARLHAQLFHLWRSDHALTPVAPNERRLSSLVTCPSSQHPITANHWCIIVALKLTLYWRVLLMFIIFERVYQNSSTLNIAMKRINLFAADHYWLHFEHAKSSREETFLQYCLVIRFRIVRKSWKHVSS